MEFTSAIMDTIVAYGALGACTVYFMAKDWTKTKETNDLIEKNTQAMANFTSAVSLLTDMVKK